MNVADYSILVVFGHSVAELHACTVETALIKKGSLHLTLVLLHCMLAVLVLLYHTTCSVAMKWTCSERYQFQTCFFALFHACSVL